VAKPASGGEGRLTLSTLDSESGSESESESGNEREVQHVITEFVKVTCRLTILSCAMGLPRARPIQDTANVFPCSSNPVSSAPVGKHSNLR
jgi:hypothetical protein